MNCTNSEIGELIGGYELGLLSKEERRLFEDHLLDCECCLQSLYQTAPLSNMIREEKLAPDGDFEITDELDEAVFIKPLKKSGLTRILGKKWVYTAVGVAAVMAVVITTMWLRGPRTETARLRGYDEVSILVVSPVGEVTTLGEIKWKAISGVESYEVKIFTEARDLVWKESVKGSNAVIPSDIRKILIPGQTYFWQVEALTAEESRLRSQEVWFKIKKIDEVFNDRVISTLLLFSSKGLSENSFHPDFLWR